MNGERERERARERERESERAKERERETTVFSGRSAPAAQASDDNCDQNDNEDKQHQ